MIKVSFSKAQSFINKLRYKSRKEWSDDDRVYFKICNFAVLSRKRLNDLLFDIERLSKLSDKSHYKYDELDVKLIKELILKKLDDCFEKFREKVSIIKEIDLEKIEEHIAKIKDENLRLENEVKRLNFIIENFIREKKINEIEEIKEILESKLFSKRIKSKKKKDTRKLRFDEESIQDFIKKWEQGQTTFEITESLNKLTIDIGETRKKKRIKL